MLNHHNQITSVGLPDCLEPDCLEPDCLEPDCLEPDCLEPDCLEPDCLEPDCLEPDCLEPDCLEPDCLEPDCLDPDCLDPAGLLYCLDTLRRINQRIINLVIVSLSKSLRGLRYAIFARNPFTLTNNRQTSCLIDNKYDNNMFIVNSFININLLINKNNCRVIIANHYYHNNYLYIENKIENTYEVCAILKGGYDAS